MITEKQTTTLSISGKTLVISYRQFTEEFDVEDVLRIDIQRLAIEMITFPVVINRLSILLADANNSVKAAELDLEIFLAQRRDYWRTWLIDNREAGEKLTVDDMKFKQEYRLKSEPAYKIKHQVLNNAIKARDYVNSLFWAAKDKSEKMNFLASQLRGGKTLEELVDEGFLKGQMNGVVIKVGKPLIED